MHVAASGEDGLWIYLEKVDFFGYASYEIRDRLGRPDAYFQIGSTGGVLVGYKVNDRLMTLC